MKKPARGKGRAGSKQVKNQATKNPKRSRRNSGDLEAMRPIEGQCEVSPALQAPDVGAIGLC